MYKKEDKGDQEADLDLNTKTGGYKLGFYLVLILSRRLVLSGLLRRVPAYFPLFHMHCNLTLF